MGTFEGFEEHVIGDDLDRVSNQKPETPFGTF